MIQVKFATCLTSTVGQCGQSITMKEERIN